MSKVGNHLVIACDTQKKKRYGQGIFIEYVVRDNWMVTH